MKNIQMIVWITQLGLSVAFPLAGFILLALWLHNDRGWGAWVIWVGVILGFIGAAEGLVSSLRTMERLSRPKDKPEPPPVSFNDHD